MTARERIEMLLDPDSPFLELSPLAAYGSAFTVGASVVAGIGAVSGVECLVVSNDPTVKGGTSNPWTLKKILRANQIAFENRLPVISLVESGGADLPTQKEIFIPGGRMFRDLTRLSAAGIPTIALVFGNSTAGGAYIPGMSDHVVMIKERSKVFLAGPPLVKMATGEESDDESLGGAEMHARTSGLADYFAVDELDAIRIGRRIVARLNWRKQGPAPGPVVEPLFDAEELIGIVPSDLRIPFDPRDVIARVVDGSEFDEFKALYGSSLVTGWATLYGYPIGILANHRGVLFSEESQKATQFIQLANRSDTPLLFLHNTTGYMVGKKYEEGGMIKHGSMMINAVSNSTVPHLSLLIGASYGAGHYGMCGRAYDPRFLFAWPSAKSAVMGGAQLAGVLSIVSRAAAEARGQQVDEDADAAMRAAVEGQIEAESLPMVLSGMLYDDGVIDPRDTRTVLGMCLSAIANAPDQGDVELRRLPDVSTDGHTSAGRQPRRDRPPGVRHLPPSRDRHRRRVHRPRCRLAARRRGRCAGAAGGPQRVPGHAAVDRGGPRGGRRRRPPRLRIPLGERGFRRRRAGRRFDVDRPSGRRGGGDGLQDRGQEDDGRRGRAGARRTRSRHRDGRPTAGADQGVGGRRRPRHAGGPWTCPSCLHKWRPHAARRSRRSAIPTVFCERYLATGHHVEVQVLADEHGTVWAVGERECSIQRRHQKIIEEAPSPLVERTPGMRDKLFDAARLAATAIGYTGAGTVEFMADESGDFFFLEMNTRLQVEHPVTEATTGLDLVGLQLQVADGGHLDPEPPPSRGYSIEARLYAEDPAKGWQPQAGPVHRFEVPNTTTQFGPLDGLGVRVDTGIVDGSEVSVFYDPMLAKIISYAPTRRQAAGLLADALARTRIHGVRTNRDLLVNVLRHPAFLDGATDTAFFDTHGLAELAGPLADQHAVELSALAAALADAAQNRQSATVFAAAPSGWRNVASGFQTKRYSDSAGETHEVRYRFTRSGMELPGHDAVTLVSATPDQVVLAVDGVDRPFDVARYGDDVFVDSPLGPVQLVALPRFPDPTAALAHGSLLAPMPGSVLRIGAAVGDTVTAGQPLIWLEAMKMEHTVTAPGDGVLVELNVDPGQQVDVGAVLARVDDPEGDQ